MKTDITDELLETLRGIKEGRKWEFKTSTSPNWREPSWDALWIVLSTSGSEVRLKPEPQTVPLSFEDVKPGMVFRKKGAKMWNPFKFVHFDGIGVKPSVDYYTRWTELQEDWEWSWNATDWQPCQKISTN